MLKLKDAAKELNISYIALYNFVRSGQVKSVKLGSDYRITREEMDYIRENGTRPKNKVE